MILTVRTAHIAAKGTDGEYHRTRHEAGKRFLFHGIESQRSQKPVVHGYILSALVFPDMTKANLAFRKAAMPEADIAYYLFFTHYGAPR